MMGMATGAPPPAPENWSILAVPASQQVAVLTVLQQLVEMLQEPSLADRLADLVAREHRLDERARDLEIRERGLETRSAKIRQALERLDVA